MAAYLPSEGQSLANMPGAISLVSLLERGFAYTQQGYFAEGAACFALAREQLSPGQAELADLLDEVLLGYTEYQRIQQALQEASIRFAEAYSKQQVRTAALETELPKLIKDISDQQRLPYLSPNAAKQYSAQLPPTLYLLPQGSRKSSTTSIQSEAPQESTSLPELSITCFGQFEIRRSGKPISLCSSRSGQSILRYLVAKPGHFASSDILQTLLWPEDEPEIAQRKLHIAISALRRSLIDNSSASGLSSIVYKNGIYALNPEIPMSSDLDEFLRCYQAGQRASGERVVFYERACLLYTGPFLPEDIYADWSFLQREQLSQAYFAMCSVLTDHYLQIKRYDAAAHWATAILKENRCDEAAHRQLMQIYAAQGRRSEALQQYQRCEHVLREELGVQPLPETMLVFHALLTNDPPTEDIAKT